MTFRKTRRIEFTSYQIGRTTFMVARCQRGQQLHDRWEEACRILRENRANKPGKYPKGAIEQTKIAAAAYWRHRNECWECANHGCGDNQ